MTANSLKPCPFCGFDSPTMRIYKGKDGWRDRYAVICRYDEGGCGAEGGMYHSATEAAEAWNRRAEIEIVNRQIAHAYWEPSEDGEYHCTHCGVECDIDEFHKALLNRFCGNCGAEMW